MKFKEYLKQYFNKSCWSCILKTIIPVEFMWIVMYFIPDSVTYHQGALLGVELIVCALVPLVGACISYHVDKN